ncbi:MAG TPA: helical backbone metal receptor [Burkholderiales bacterium]|nr:helical backbone metal receptor [Burkholderiales bacterium]
MRIVSLVPSLTELVCALGLAERLVGRTGFCVHPRDIVRRIPKVGGTKDVNLDRVRALEPTHVILNMDENRKETAEALARFVPHLVVTHPLGPLDNLALYRQFGVVFGRAREAEALCARFDEAYAAVRATTFPPRNVLYLIWKDPWMTVSRDTYISRTLALFGMQTLPATTPERYPQLSDLRLQGIDAVLLSTEPYRFGERHRAQVESLAGCPAHLVDGEMTSWYGPRAIAGLAYLKAFAARVAGVS